MLRMQANLKPMVSQGATYLLLLAFITVFVLLVNWYNVKQLAQLKEEYGLDERQPAPEFWWRKALIYHIYVHSFQDSDGNGIGDINGCYFITFHVSHRRHEMYIDHVCLCVCVCLCVTLSVCPSLHAHTTARTRM